MFTGLTGKGAAIHVLTCHRVRLSDGTMNNEPGLALLQEEKG